VAVCAEPESTAGELWDTRRKAGSKPLPVGTGVNLASFAELAVRLVNSGVSDADVDPLGTQETFREMVADRPFLAVPMTQHDLDRLKLLRTELTAIFTLAVEGAGPAAVDRLNGLLMIHPMHPVIVGHDGKRWHLHLHESGSVTDRYASAAVASLAIIVTQLGTERLGICAIASCDRVYVDGSSNRSRRYCKQHGAVRANVTSLRHGQSAVAGADPSAAAEAS
jgi:predicted RNA-binding Zn ribbon-like protein